jgi:drug/metabolite transporter (DMT)-like permease
LLLGILFGFSAALSQSLSYVFSRLFVSRHERGVFDLFVLSHILMAAGALLLLPFLWPEGMPGVHVYGGDLLATTLFYIAGQVGLFQALKHTDASRVAPLLGLKLPLLTVISVVLGARFTPWQWSAVLLSVTGALALNWSGRRLPWASAAWVLWTCLGYSLSDIYIRRLMEHFSGLPSISMFHRAALGTSLSYALCGVVGLALLPGVRVRKPRVWLEAIPYSVAWFLGMLCLFGCFGQINVVFGNIIQASRGVISILFGIGLAKAGFTELEQRVPRGVLLRRLGAALLMIGAIALFYRAELPS